MFLPTLRNAVKLAAMHCRTNDQGRGLIMELRSRTIDADTLRGIVRTASDAIYAGNVITHAEDMQTLRDGTKRVRFTLKVRRSAEKGAHYSPSGRRTISACWHAHRDIMREIFRHDPNASISSALARYANARDFVLTFPRTFYRNAGSMARPMHYGTLCRCGNTQPGSSTPVGEEITSTL